MLKYHIFTCKIRFFENVFRQKLIQNGAGEARDPSRKMRLEKTANSARNQFEMTFVVRVMAVLLKHIFVIYTSIFN